MVHKHEQGTKQGKRVNEQTAKAFGWTHSAHDILPSRAAAAMACAELGAVPVVPKLYINTW